MQTTCVSVPFPFTEALTASLKPVGIQVHTIFGMYLGKLYAQTVRGKDKDIYVYFMQDALLSPRCTHSLTALISQTMTASAGPTVLHVHTSVGERIHSIHPPFGSIPFGCWWSSLSDRGLPLA